MEVNVISEKKQEFGGENYYLCGSYYQRKGVRLHRAVWEYHNGSIPDGYHIHHIDGNRDHNYIENLAMIEATAHERVHMSQESRRALSRECVKKAIAAAPAWHKSEDGRAWHSKQAKMVWKRVSAKEFSCDYCGKPYKTTAKSTSGNHFCSPRCRAAYRRDSGIDDEARKCEYCGKEYIVNKYALNRFCSAGCARKNRWGDRCAC